MKTPLLSWAASAALHGAAGLMALTWVVDRALETEREGASPAGRAPERSRRRGDDGASEVRFRIVPPAAARERQEVGTSSIGSCNAKGESADFVSDRPFKGKGIYDVAGAGAGGGGRYGGPLQPEDGRGDGASSPQARSAGRDAVLAALAWLAPRQDRYGGWTLPDSGELDVAATGLAVLAFLEAGFGPESEESLEGLRAGRVIHHAIQALLLAQQPDGSVGAQAGPRAPVDHALGALALAAAWRRTRSPLLAEPARRAAARLVSAAPIPEAEAWRVLALRCAGETDLDIPRVPLPRMPAARGVYDPPWEGRTPAERVALRKRLLALQHRAPEHSRDGSWDPPAEWGDPRGVVLATALNALTLAIE